MASEELFEAEFSEEQDLEHQQAMETEEAELAETEEPLEITEESPDNPEAESTTEQLTEKPGKLDALR